MLKSFSKILIFFIFYILFFIFYLPVLSQTPGDANADGKVDGLDYVIWLNNYNKTVANGVASADFDINGKVDGLDYVVWLNNYNSTTIVTPTSSLPSPTSGPQPTIPSGTTPIKIATGTYPNIAVDAQGDAHIVYESNGKLMYRKFTASTNSLGNEQDTGISQNASYRNDPDVAIDSQNHPHVLGGLGNNGGKYAYWNGTTWAQIGSFNRDTAIDIDTNDNVFVVQRAGASGGYLGLFKRAANATTFTQLPDPDIANSLPKGENDHVYADIFINKKDNPINIVYRHGPTGSQFSYRSSNDGGNNWSGGGVSNDDTEAPSGAGHINGTNYVISGNGTVFFRSGLTGTWAQGGHVVSAATRHLPSITVDKNGNIYVTSFGGKYNIQKTGSQFTGERKITSLSGQAIGFVRTAGSSGFAYVVWEEGASVNAANDNQYKNFDLIFATLDADGIEVL